MFKVGDRVTRWLAGTIPIKLTVTNIEGSLVYCGDWSFDLLTGAEVDFDLGWGPPPKHTGSFIVPDYESISC